MASEITRDPFICIRKKKTQLRERPVPEGYEQERGQHRPD